MNEPPNVKGIVAAYLEQHGFDGLCGLDDGHPCYCKLDDLFPCGMLMLDDPGCCPGYLHIKTKRNGAKEEDICLNKPAPAEDTP